MPDDMGKWNNLSEDSDECESHWQLFTYIVRDKTIELLTKILDRSVTVSLNESARGGCMWNFYTTRKHTHDYQGTKYPEPYTYNEQIGCMALVPLNSEIIWSQAVYLGDKYRGVNLGQRLLDLRLLLCAEAGFKQYWCSVSEDNIRQQHILTKHGFTTIPGTRVWTKVL